MPKLLFNIPNLLSAYRIAAVPLLLLFFYIAAANADNGMGAVATWINVAIFFLACISDFLDGFIARHTGQITTFGKFLDHTSDKILIGGVLLLLIAFDRLTGIWIIPALIIFSREIMVSGLREFLGQYNVAVPVSLMGKWKTAVQMLASGFLIAGNYGDALVPHSLLIGQGVFLIATAMTVISGWDYLKAGIETLRGLDAEQKS